MKWYEVDKKRLVIEYERVKRKYPQFNLLYFENGLAWEGTIYLDSDDNEYVPLKIRIIYDVTYPVKAPKVFPIEPEIPEELWGHEWHKWKEGNICYINPKKWNINYYTVDIIEKIEMWYRNFLLLLFGKIKEMPDIGFAST